MKIDKYQFIKLAFAAVAKHKRIAIKFYVNGKSHILASPNMKEDADMWTIMSDWIEEKVFTKNLSFSSVSSIEACHIWDSKPISKLKSLEFLIFDF